jgi:hypothetical protein
MRERRKERGSDNNENKVYGVIRIRREVYQLSSCLAAGTRCRAGRNRLLETSKLPSSTGPDEEHGGEDEDQADNCVQRPPSPSNLSASQNSQVGLLFVNRSWVFGGFLSGLVVSEVHEEDGCSEDPEEGEHESVEEHGASKSLWLRPIVGCLAVALCLELDIGDSDIGLEIKVTLLVFLLSRESRSHKTRDVWWRRRDDMGVLRLCRVNQMGETAGCSD